MDDHSSLTSSSLASLNVQTFLLGIGLLIIALILYRAYFDQLRDVSGPLICRLTPLLSWYHTYVGDESSWIDSIHRKYGPVVRISPNEVVISEGEALAPIYSPKGGFLKASYYSNFDIDGHPSIFSSTDPEHRAVRHKEVVSMFSVANVRNRSRAIEECVDDFVKTLQREANRSRMAAEQTGKAVPVNVLRLSRRLTFEAVCSYLFHERYGVIDDEITKSSPSDFVNAFAVMGRFLTLPSWLFARAAYLYERLYDSEGSDCNAQVQAFADKLVANSREDVDAYQSRLLSAGISPQETSAQMQDVMFAGTDTTGTNVAHLLFQLAKHPAMYKRLREEVLAPENANTNPQNLPYLDAVIKEGLRTSMANATRFPRQVPPSGFIYTSSSTNKTYHFPAGRIVGVSPYSLHFNPAIFPSPHEFNPDRWLDNVTPEMQRDFIPFGQGSRQCIARNLAMRELALVLRAVAVSNVSEAARTCVDKIEVYEWFNAVVKGGRVDLVWE